MRNCLNCSWESITDSSFSFGWTSEVEVKNNWVGVKPDFKMEG
jgi:hypothetical protein